MHVKESAIAQRLGNVFHCAMGESGISQPRCEGTVKVLRSGLLVR